MYLRNLQEFATLVLLWLKDFDIDENERKNMTLAIQNCQCSLDIPVQKHYPF